MATTAPGCIDEEINEHTVNLRAQKNSFLPIFRLPTEILESIFIRAACDYHEETYKTTFCVPRWVNVSYVCHHWRSTALNCPPLWTYHFTVSLRWTEELLARSRRASLKIRINHDFYRDVDWWSCLVEKVLNHAERIQELRLNIPWIVAPKWPPSAPRLQVLDIRGGHWDSSSTITHGDTSALCTLKLSRCVLPWHSIFNLSGVTTLIVHFIPFESQQNLMDFLSTLSRMQALTDLDLADALTGARDFFSTGEPRSSHPKLNLRCLSRLSMWAPLSTVVALLLCIDIPSKTHLRLECEIGDNASIDDYGQISFVLAQMFSRAKDLSSPSLVLRSLAIFSSSQWGFAISASEHGCDPDLLDSTPPRERDVPLTILVDMLPTLNEYIHRIVGDICCVIPLAHVQTLHISNPPFSRVFWRKALGSLDGLRYLKLSEGHMPDLVSLLSLPADAPVEDLKGYDRDPTQRHTFVPVLELLELDRIIFESEGSLSKALSEEALLDALSTRTAHPVRLIKNRANKQ